MVDNPGDISMQPCLPHDPTGLQQWAVQGLKERYDAVLREPWSPEILALLRETGPVRTDLT